MFSSSSLYWTLTIIVLCLCPCLVPQSLLSLESAFEPAEIGNLTNGRSKQQKDISSSKRNGGMKEHRMPASANPNALSASPKHTSHWGHICPVPCACRSNTPAGHKLIVNCSGLGLATIPGNFPQSVVELYLYNNSIREISEAAFRNLSSLKLLDLSSNIIFLLVENVFAGLNNLKSLYLNNNAIDISRGRLPANIFTPLSRLTFLNLQSNKLGDDDNFEYPDDALGQIRTLESLLIDGVSNKTFARNFTYLTQLKSLDLSGTQSLEYVSKDMFEGFRHIQVKNLNLSHCDVRWIHPEAFSSLSTIDTIDVSYNGKLEIHNLGMSTYGLRNTTIRKLVCQNVHTGPMFARVLADDITNIGHTRLEELYMDHNNIDQIETDCIRRLPQTLKVLSISWNKIQSYTMQMLSIFFLRNLRVFDASFQQTKSSSKSFPEIGRNPLPETDRHSYENVPNYTPIKSINALKQYKHLPILNLPKHLYAIYVSSTFKFKLTFVNIVLRNSHLKIVNISNNLLNPWKGPVEGVQTITDLDMSGNECDQVSPTFFAYMEGLRRLFIGRNKLGPKLSDLTFYNLTKLEVLNLERNRLEHVTLNLFSRLTNIQYLTLAHNFITKWDASIASLKNLTLLDLTSNRLSAPPQSLLKDLDVIQLSTNVRVTFKDNPLYCSCETKYFAQWLTETSVEVFDLNLTTCTFSNGTSLKLSKKQIILDHLIKHCRSYGPLIASLSIIIALVVCIIGARILHRHRWKLRYLYYMAARWGETTGFERLDGADEDPFVYDAFLSYEDSDRGFIIESVIPKLETESGFRLCIDKRDFTPGLYVTDNIMNAIQHSRKTIVFLSINFLNSRWYVYELNMARMESLYHDRETLIVVIMETMTGKDLTAEVSEVLHRRSYIEKTDDPIGHDLFWARLVTAIKSN